MLYMVKKISLCGVMFDIVYNESFHENMKNLENDVFSQRVQKQLSILLKTGMVVCESTQCHHAHICS